MLSNHHLTSNDAENLRFQTRTIVEAPSTTTATEYETVSSVYTQVSVNSYPSEP